MANTNAIVDELQKHKTEKAAKPLRQ